VAPQTSGDVWCTTCDAKYGRQAEKIDWERRDELGVGVAFFRTCMGGLLRPNKYFDGVDPDGSFKDPLLLFFLLSIVASAGNVAAQASAQFRGQSAGYADIWGVTDQGPLFLAVFWLGMLVISPLASLVAQLVYAGFIHVACLFVGAEGGYRATFRAITYAIPGITIAQTAVSLLTAGVTLAIPGAAPAAGLMGGGINALTAPYLLVLIMFSLRSVHRFSTGRAIGVMAILLGGIVGLSCVIGFLIVSVAAVF
jgi:hypothetical protein